MAEWSKYCEHQDVPGWVKAEMREVFDKPRILLVEDDDDIRELLTTLLQIAGFSTQTCSTAELALEELRENEFDLVLTDYALPGRTGGWLLQQASAEGLLEATPTLIVTAHPNPPDVGGFEIIRKPFDLDDLVERVRRRVEGDVRRPPAPKAPRRPVRGNGDGREDDDRRFRHREPVELILYVSMHSPRSAAAIRNIKKALAGYSTTKVKLTICDLSSDPSKGAGDAIAFTPTLVKRSPGPRTFILGHISSPELVLDLLAGHGD